MLGVMFLAPNVTLGPGPLPSDHLPLGTAPSTVHLVRCDGAHTPSFNFRLINPSFLPIGNPWPVVKDGAALGSTHFVPGGNAFWSYEIHRSKKSRRVCGGAGTMANTQHMHAPSLSRKLTIVLRPQHDRIMLLLSL